MNAVNNDFNSFKLFGVRNLSENFKKGTSSFPRKIQVHTNHENNSRRIRSENGDCDRFGLCVQFLCYSLLSLP